MPFPVRELTWLVANNKISVVENSGYQSGTTYIIGHEKSDIYIRLQPGWGRILTDLKTYKTIKDCNGKDLKTLEAAVLARIEGDNSPTAKAISEIYNKEINKESKRLLES